ncbi:cytochrome c oxidase subunit II [Pseudochrobactrum sp. MP213Fo]|uniref:cytochrome c oxidase subunit II n=1 Tax=Pseudochrobactrum sp. MP213Fo TaxID=3022250 RepID=UPI003BA2BCA0
MSTVNRQGYYREKMLVDSVIATKKSIAGQVTALKKHIVTGAALFGSAAAGLLASSAGVLADQPVDWQLSWQAPATKIAEQIHWFERYSLMFIIPVTVLVLLLLLWCILRFRRSVNPVASKTSHNTTIEVIWTLGPVIILLFLAIPSFQLLTAQYSPEEPQLTVKATGYQWYWGYEYQTEDPLSFDALLLKDEDRAEAGKQDLAAYPRLLAVDNEVVVPVDTTVRLLVTAADVIHSWAMPAFGVKMDGVPGRNNETWFKADREGLYYGQCSELCGKDHAYMPIAVRVVSQERYDTWLAAARTDIDGANKTLMAEIANENKSVAVAGN